MVSEVAAEAANQHSVSTANLDARVALHGFGTSPVSWAEFVRERLPLNAGSRVLDAGAGTGVHWRLQTSAAPVLMDLHAPMCERLATFGHPVIQGSVQVLPLGDGVMDGVLCAHVLYHLDDPQGALDELLRVLRPEGWIALASNGRGHMLELRELAAHAGLPRSAGAHDRFTIEDAMTGLRERGMQPSRHDFDDDLHVTDAEAVVSYLQSLPGHLADEPRERIRESLAARIAADGHFVVRKETALVLAYRPA